jgi:hemerythrin superfamily protein
MVVHMGDALDLLHDDHEQVDALYEQLGRTDAPAERRALVDAMIRALSQHIRVEEEVFYPAIVGRVDGGPGFVGTNLEEHRRAAELMHRLETLDAEDRDFSPAAGGLMKAVRVHVAAEEKQLFPRVRAVLSAAELEEMAARIEQRRGAEPARRRSRGRGRTA